MMLFFTVNVLMGVRGHVPAVFQEGAREGAKTDVRKIRKEKRGRQIGKENGRAKAMIKLR